MEKNNSFDFVKLIAAFLVIIGHAPVLAEGKTGYIGTITNGQLDLGNFAVCIFFIIGGYFIAKSLINSKNGKEYFIKRIKRIFPPLIIAMFITTFILAPFFFNGSFIEYYKNFGPYKYFLKNSLLITAHQIDGVFTGNIYADSINGSLWTLPVEFLSYIGLFIVYKVGLLKEKNTIISRIIVLVLMAAQPLIYIYFPILESVLPLFLLFYVGAMYYVNRDKIKYNNKLFILCIILLLISIKLNIYMYTKIILLPYIILTIGFNFRLKLPIIEKLSYEIYLYAFFIAQAIIYCFKGSMNMHLNILITSLITIVVAYISNKLLQIIKKS